MGKQKIIEAAKKKGLTVEWAEWGWAAGDRERYQQWIIMFGPEIDELYGQDQDQYFSHTAETLEWIDSLEPLPPREDEKATDLSNVDSRTDEVP